MHPFLRRVIGVTLIIAAILGLLFSTVGIATVWILEPKIEASLNRALVTAGNILDTSAEALAIADKTLNTTVSSMESMKGAVESAAKTLDQIEPLADALSKLSKDTIPGTLKATQSSLNSAAESAKVVDNVLGALNSLPFVPKDLYNPTVPLHESLGNVANSLNDYLTSLETTQKSLADVSGSMSGIQAQLTGMADQIGNIGTSMKEAQAVVQKYQTLVKTTQERADWLKTNLNTILIILGIVTTLILIWVMVVQLALFVQGWTLLKEPQLVAADRSAVRATPLPNSATKPIVQSGPVKETNPEIDDHQAEADTPKKPI